MPRANIDFTNTSGSGRLKEGTYRARLDQVEEKDGREYPLWVWTFTSLEPETAGRQSQHTTSLSPKAACYIRFTLEALGAEVPASMADVDTDQFIGREAMILVGQDGTFTGQDGQEYPSYKIQRLFPIVGNSELVQVPERTSAAAPAAAAAGLLERDQVHFASDDIPF